MVYVLGNPKIYTYDKKIILWKIEYKNIGFQIYKLVVMQVFRIVRPRSFKNNYCLRYHRMTIKFLASADDTPGMNWGQIGKIMANVNEEVKFDDTVMEVETGKAPYIERPFVNGRVIAMHIEEGATVKNGEKLFSVEYNSHNNK